MFSKSAFTWLWASLDNLKRWHWTDNMRKNLHSSLYLAELARLILASYHFCWSCFYCVGNPSLVFLVEAQVSQIHTIEELLNMFAVGLVKARPLEWTTMHEMIQHQEKTFFYNNVFDMSAYFKRKYTIQDLQQKGDHLLQIADRNSHLLYTSNDPC